MPPSLAVLMSSQAAEMAVLPSSRFLHPCQWMLPHGFSPLNRNIAPKCCCRLASPPDVANACKFSQENRPIDFQP